MSDSSRWVRRVAASLLALAHLSLVSGTVRAASGDDPHGSGVETENEVRSGILAVPVYSGDVWTRPYLSGDWGGVRQTLAERGVQLSLEWTQTLQSVVDGGTDHDARYNGSPDLKLALDFDRMGILPGATLTVRVESRYGESVNERTGSVLPASTDAFVPLVGETDENTLVVTNFLYQQLFTDNFGILLGKFDNLESDFNEFASGRGTSQFQNANFVFTPVSLLEPYSSLGAILILAPHEQVFVWGGLYNTTEASADTGFEDLDDGTSWFTEIYVQHGLRSLPPGGASFGFIYNFNNDFVNIRKTRLVDGPTGPALRPATDEQAWAAYGSVWQYLWTEESAEGKILDVQNHEIDLEGVGFFLRAGGGDADVNPIEWTLSGGLSGRGVLPSRDDDTFGLGYYFTSLRDNRLAAVLDVKSTTHGFEAYYSAALTGATRLTTDLQVLDSPAPRTDTAVVLGLRLQTNF